MSQPTAYLAKANFGKDYLGWLGRHAMWAVKSVFAAIGVVLNGHDESWLVEKCPLAGLGLRKGAGATGLLKVNRAGYKDSSTGRGAAS